MGVTLTVLDRAGDFRMADYYEQVNSYVEYFGGQNYFTRDGLIPSSTILSGPGNNATFGVFDLNLLPVAFSYFAVFQDDPADANHTFNALTGAIDAGKTGTEAVAAALIGDDTIVGAKHNDELWGFAGGDRMLGFGGNDILHGGDGDDRLYGDRGNDRLEGGKGRDRFVYEDIDGLNPGGWGKDVILDFEHNRDRIEFHETRAVRRFSDLTITAKQGDAVIATGDGETITLKGVDATTLSARDFAFVRSPSLIGPDAHAWSDVVWLDQGVPSAALIQLA